MSLLPFPIPLYFDADGSALEDGYIYIGEAGQNARENPIQVYWDADLTETAAQPVRTSGGYPVYQGAPSGLFIAETAASVTVLDRNQQIVLFNEDVFASGGGGGGSGSYVINSRAEAQTVDIPTGVDYVQTGGYYVAGDWGGAQFKRVTGPLSDGASFQSADGAWWKYAEPVAYVRAFGAKGDNSTNDTTAIDDAWNWAQNNGTNYTAINSDSAPIYTTSDMVFDGGVYIYSGTGLVNSVGTGRGFSFNARGTKLVRITTTTDVYFFDAVAARSAYVYGIEFSGGKGAFTWSTTSAVVCADNPVFQQCNFNDYSQCAIGSDSSDHPGLVVRDCAFNAYPTGSVFGIAWGGNCDTVYIDHNIFGGNAVHVKLGGGGLSGSVYVTRNGFFRGFQSGGSSNKIADVWLCARSAIDNSGYGTIVEANKFGSEQRTTEETTPRVLFALEDTANPTHTTRLPSTSASGYISGINFRNNIILGLSGEDGGYIKSNVRRVAMIFDHSNILIGTYKPYILEFSSGAISAGLFEANNAWDVEIQPIWNTYNNNQGQVVLPINADATSLTTDFRPAMVSTLRSYLPGMQGSGFVPLAQLDAVDAILSVATATVVNDVRGQPRAREVTFTNTGGSIQARVTSGYDNALPLWVEVEIKAAAAQALTFVQLAIDRLTSFAFGSAYPVAIGSEWRTVRIPVANCRVDDGSLILILQPLNAYFSSGVTDRIQVGRMRVYQGETAHDGIVAGAYNPGDADYDYPAGAPVALQFTTALTAGRTLTLLNANRMTGDEVTVNRIDAGLFNLTVKAGTSGGTTIATLATGTWATFSFNAGAWIRTATGTV